MESDRGAKTLGNSWRKLFRTRWCSAVMEQKREIKGWWDSWGPGIAPCPASVIKTIFLTSKLPPLIMSLTFQLESSRLGIPNSGADFLPVSGQPWHACLWNGDLCQLCVWLGSCIWRAQQDPGRASEGRAGDSCLLQAEFGLEQSWFSSKMSQSAGPLWSLKTHTHTHTHTVLSLPVFDGPDMWVILSSFPGNLWGAEPGREDLELGRGFHCLEWPITSQIQCVG